MLSVFIHHFNKCRRYFTLTVEISLTIYPRSNTMNYFNTLPLRLQLDQLGKCRFMDRTEFSDDVDKLRGKKVVIVGCGAQGLNQGLNMRDRALIFPIPYAK